MNLSLFSDYALRILMYGALKKAAFQLDEVTAAYGISRNHVAKVIQRLAQLGYLETRRGRGGGIQLGRPAEEIRIGQLVRKTEGSGGPVECFDLARNRCRVSPNCRLKGALGEAMNAFYGSLDRFSLRDLVEGPHREAMRETLLGSVENAGEGTVAAAAPVEGELVE